MYIWQYFLQFKHLPSYINRNCYNMPIINKKQKEFQKLVDTNKATISYFHQGFKQESLSLTETLTFWDYNTNMNP